MSDYLTMGIIPKRDSGLVSYHPFINTIHKCIPCQDISAPLLPSFLSLSLALHLVPPISTSAALSAGSANHIPRCTFPRAALVDRQELMPGGGQVDTLRPETYL